VCVCVGGWVAAGGWLAGLVGGLCVCVCCGWRFSLCGYL
jgi:hypothetical protein